jgi:hypothetical protein
MFPKLKGEHLHFNFVEAGRSKKIFIKSAEIGAALLDREKLEASEFKILPGKFLCCCYSAKAYYLP